MELKHRHALYRSKIPAASAISTSYECYIRKRFKPVFRAIKPVFFAPFTMVHDDINYLRHVRGLVHFRINHSTLGRCTPSGLMIYSGNVPHRYDITNTYIRGTEAAFFLWLLKYIYYQELIREGASNSAL